MRCAGATGRMGRLGDFRVAIWGISIGLAQKVRKLGPSPSELGAGEEELIVAVVDDFHFFASGVGGEE